MRSGACGNSSAQLICARREMIELIGHISQQEAIWLSETTASFVWLL